MRQKGNWINQKRKKQSMPLVVVPLDAGRWFGRLLNEGQIAVCSVAKSVCRSFVSAREEEGQTGQHELDSCSALVGVDGEPEPRNDHATDDAEPGEVVAERSSGRDLDEAEVTR